MTTARTPRRVQLVTGRGRRLPPLTVRVDRNTRWANPFVDAPELIPGTVVCDRRGTIATPGAQAAVDAYANWLGSTDEGRALANLARRRLAGLNLACRCLPGVPCHADVLLRVANTSERSA